MEELTGIDPERVAALEPGDVAFGKSIAARVPLATYGMRDEIAAVIAPPEEARVASGVFTTRSPPAGRCSPTPSRWRPGAPPSPRF
jgi:hypothetical protein